MLMYSRVARLFSRIILTIVALTIAGLIQVPVMAQTDQGRTVGTVTDASGGIVPGASVLVKNERTGEERTATTNESGYFMVASLKPSLYTVSVTAQNMTVRVTNVQVLVGQELNLPLTL